MNDTDDKTSSTIAIKVAGRTTHIRFHYQHVYLSARPTLGAGAPQWIPSVDLYETDKEIILEVDLGGVGSDEMQVHFTGRSVHLSGSRRERAESSVKIFHVMEIERGQFMRTIDLPALVEPNTVRAAYSEGLLVVRVSKRHAAIHGCRQARNREGLE